MYRLKWNIRDTEYSGYGCYLFNTIEECQLNCNEANKFYPGVYHYPEKVEAVTANGVYHEVLKRKSFKEKTFLQRHIRRTTDIYLTSPTAVNYRYVTEAMDALHRFYFPERNNQPMTRFTLTLVPPEGRFSWNASRVKGLHALDSARAELKNPAIEEVSCQYAQTVVLVLTEAQARQCKGLFEDEDDQSISVPSGYANRFPQWAIDRTYASGNRAYLRHDADAILADLIANDFRVISPMKEGKHVDTVA